ncbi:MAG TPA: adenylosuccinate lyase [Candidatus Absconditabacterales bacterium]|nr:adenylosuccinate lyase [Candidatus Absconditabacterales bacterium]
MKNGNKLELNQLTAISSIDGRYGSRTAPLREYLSEYALFKYRTLVELKYFLKMSKTVPQLSDFDIYLNMFFFDSFITQFSLENAEAIKNHEKTTNHDVKAVEYFLRSHFDEMTIGKFKEFIHFGLTSYDVNSPAVNMMVRDALTNVIIPELDELILKIQNFAVVCEDIPMLAHTHGQPASPTRLDKEIRVFIDRLIKLRQQIKNYEFEAKFGGATGNFNAHYAAYPDIDWHDWAEDFLLEELNLKRQKTTTQIESYDNLAELFDLLKRLNTVFIDLSRDMWTYISMNYFNQKPKKDEVGSSAMPHKVNPIDFENAEGNAGISIALFEHLSTKLPVSRLQRDLSGSTVERVIGLPIAHFLVSILSLQKAFGKIVPNKKKIDYDLEQNWAVIAEGIQTILRREGYPDPYTALKKLTRKGENELITREVIHTWINNELDISDKIKTELKALTPWNYVGK